MNGLKCNTCIHEWYYSGDLSSPYGEYSCFKTGDDLYGVEPEDVENCPDYECKNKSNEYVNDYIEACKEFSIK